MARKQCRLWWPKHLLSRKPSSDLLLFGWYMHSLNSLDIVVAVAISPYEVSVHLLQSDLQLLLAFPEAHLHQLAIFILESSSSISHSSIWWGFDSKSSCLPHYLAIFDDEIHEILQSINSKMPMPLQESTTFSILGQCAVDFSKGDMKTMSNRNSDLSLKSMQCHLVEKNDITKAISCDNVNKKCKKKSSLEAPSAENCRSWNCGCEKLTQYIEPHREVLIRHGNWIRLLSKSQGILCKESRWIPEFHHMHQNGHILSICDVHLIIYEPPTYGRHHFSLSSWGYSEQAETPLKKPNWVNDLHQKSLPLNLEAVVSALNCASAAMVYFKIHLGTINAVVHFHFISRLVSVLWYMLAVSVSSISTGIYVILQFFHRFVSFGSHTFFFVMLRKVFTQTWKNVHIRSSQFLYWPIFLQSSGFRSQSNIEYAHKSALRKHFIWSSVAMDLILGIIFGTVVLANVEAIWFWILSVVRHITDNLLRSGCVWLMGVPAGFKLNTELAELLGMVSLTAIHIFSTLWFFMGALFWHSIKGLALSGIFFGVTVPAALCIDMLKLAAVHILALHWLISFLYSLQIQALASLWRLFRGRKWNPLRQRLDSYDYTVEQHVVGSLFFTPLLLLLPTTSVFYIFYTILNTTISSICIIIEITISILHATPYAEIFLWMVRRRRFPSGLWFEILPGPTVFASTSCGLDQGKTSDIINTGPETVVSLLHSNYATIGQIITPSYRNLFCRNNPSFNMPSAVLSGQRIPSTLQTSLAPTLPWMHISCREYWRLCYSAVLACRSSQ